MTRPCRTATPEELERDHQRQVRARADARCDRCGEYVIDRRWRYCSTCRRLALQLGVIPSELPPAGALTIEKKIARE